jgi:hypothetical protein
MKKVLAILAMAAFVACGDSAAPAGENKDTVKPADTVPAAPVTPPAADTMAKKDTVKPTAAPAADAKKDTMKKK